MLNQTFMYENAVVASRQKIANVEIHQLKNIPIEPPPLRDLPRTEGAMLLQVETNDGVIG
ncbi:MAG: hypothetical protein E5Y88_19300 [Mesorhizobium sp.]|uniref:hypothetical protein n=1 Tax=Mesorhizobium sp. TaxID=1871066 RepID=UPI000FE5B343|nr:hypothetical protein [Mesorhizobium sp.]RWQ39892.1 MAG: hypothetical protein EOS20_04765 [Mesorhizobium sp.]TIL24029.1 MAG: hypothetical protein E5Y88_19300 [Mesorhizobium sp.]